MMKQAKVLCIGGSDSSGGAGIQADLKAVSACGCYGMNVITAVTAQNSLGVEDIFPVSQNFIARQLDAVLSDIGANAVKTGMMLKASVVRTVADKIAQYGIEKLVVDPVMFAKGGCSLMEDEARAVLMNRLMPLAFVITPNIPEAEYLARMNIKSIAAMKKAAVKIQKLGAKNVVIKGGHLPGGKRQGAIDILYDGIKYYEYSSAWIDSQDTHGTGCTYAAVLAANLALEKNIIVAAQQAKIMVTAAIENALSLGKGHGPVNVLGKIF